jgi:hypothetical protein
MMVQGTRWYITTNAANGHTSVSYIINDDLIGQVVPVPAEKRHEFQLRILLEVMRSGEISEAKAIASRTIRDKQLANQLLSCRSTRDFKSCMATVESMIAREDLRYIEGRCSSDLYPRTAKVVMLDTLQALADVNARWLPFEPRAQLMSSQTDKVDDDMNIFTPDYALTPEGIAGILVPITVPVTSKRGTLVSFSVRLPGSIRVNPRAAKRCGLPTEWRCNSHRRYALALDGKRLYDYIIVQISNNDAQRLSEFDDVLSYEFLGDGRYKVKLPQDVVDQTRSTVPASELYEVFRQHISLDYQKRAISFLLKRFADKERAVAYYALADKGVLGPQVRTNESWRPKRMSADALRILADHGVNSSNNYIGINRKVVSTVDPQQPLYGVNLTGFSRVPDVAKVFATDEQKPVSRQLMKRALNLYQDCDAETLITRQMTLRSCMTALKLKQFELMGRLMFNHATVTGSDLVSQTLDKVVIKSSKNPAVEVVITLNKERIVGAIRDSESIRDQFELPI